LLRGNPEDGTSGKSIPDGIRWIIEKTDELSRHFGIPPTKLYMRNIKPFFVRAIEAGDEVVSALINPWNEK
jgi:hypothetical protein